MRKQVGERGGVRVKAGSRTKKCVKSFPAMNVRSFRFPPTHALLGGENRESREKERERERERERVRKRELLARASTYISKLLGRLSGAGLDAGDGGRRRKIICVGRRPARDARKFWLASTARAPACLRSSSDANANAVI